jgi:hypothetical protein
MKFEHRSGLFKLVVAALVPLSIVGCMQRKAVDSSAKEESVHTALFLDTYASDVDSIKFTEYSVCKIIPLNKRDEEYSCQYWI